MDNGSLFRKIIDEGFNKGNLAVADEICAAKLIEHEYLAPTDVPGPDILKGQIQAARSEMQDLQISIEDMVVQGDTVWARSRATGRSRSGQKVSIYVFDVCRFKDGRLVEHWGVPDRFALLHQSGMLAPPPA